MPDHVAASPLEVENNYNEVTIYLYQDGSPTSSEVEIDIASGDGPKAVFVFGKALAAERRFSLVPATTWD